jgi:hypothetical protein
MDDALNQLRDLHLPEAPGIWPPAPGWWIAAAIAIVACALLFIRLYRTRRRGAWLRHAVGALDQLLASTRDGSIAARDFADAVNALLKRAVIHGAHRQEAAPLTGSAWLEYLDRIVARDAFTHGPGRALGNARFAPTFASDPDALHAAARDVLRALQKPTPIGRATGVHS